MAFRRRGKRNYGKRRRPKRVFKRKLKRARKIHYIKRKSVSEITVSTSNQAGGVAYTLADIPNYSEFTTLFDEYKIAAIKVAYMPTKNVNTNTQTGTGGTITNTTYMLPTVYTVIDHNDTDTPTINDMVQNETLKISRGNQVHTRYFKPRVPCRVYAGVSDGYIYRSGQWIGTATANGDDNVPHYGLKYFFELPTGEKADNLTYKVITTFYLQFKEVI